MFTYKVFFAYISIYISGSIPSQRQDPKKALSSRRIESHPPRPHPRGGPSGGPWHPTGPRRQHQIDEVPTSTTTHPTTVVTFTSPRLSRTGETPNVAGHHLRCHAFFIIASKLSSSSYSGEIHSYRSQNSAFPTSSPAQSRQTPIVARAASSVHGTIAHCRMVRDVESPCDVLRLHWLARLGILFERGIGSLDEREPMRRHWRAAHRQHNSS